MWKGVRDLVIAGEVQVSTRFWRAFPAEELPEVLEDLEMVWVSPAHSADLQELRDTIQFLQDMENKYAKPTEFEGDFKIIRVINFSKENGQKVGAKYTDKWGNINRLTFRDAAVERGGFVEKSGDRVLDVASYGFAVDFRNAKVPVGGFCLVLTLVINNPVDTTKSYRRWVFQPIIGAQPSLPIQQPNPNGDSIVDLGSEDPGVNPS